MADREASVYPPPRGSDFMSDSFGSFGMVLVVAVLLGLRHATDPDHLTAISTLILDRGRRGARRVGAVGLVWGVGHGIALLAFGLPILFVGAYLPEAVHRAAEAAVGALIVLLAVRLLLRWRRGAFHLHPHSHGGMRHAHPHAHEWAHPEGTEHPHHHPHAEVGGRSLPAAFAIGSVHGMAGSAGVTVLLIASIPDHVQATIALASFAAATALSMGVLSAAFGHALTRDGIARRLPKLIPVIGAASLLFGLWYGLAAMSFNLAFTP
jgi:ABC-type nickel/cobalt efflux system permease component RcnA